jgi:hypothetical protein
VRPVSAQFLSALRGSHKTFARARVLSSFQTGIAPVGGIEVNIISGAVSLDGAADIRASVELTTTGGLNVFPQRASNPLTPYGNELFIESGIQLANGSVEIVSQGYFRIDSDEQSNAPHGPIRVTAYDRMKGIIEARLTTPVSFPPNTSIQTIFETLILEVYPLATIEFEDASFASSVISSTQVAEEDRFGFLNNIVVSNGKIMYWDYRGILVIKAVPDPTVSVWEVNAGTQGVLIDASRALSREGVYNAVVAVGESVNSTPPVRAIVFDNDSTSPTYWFGNFGKVPRFFSSSFITTFAQASSAAQGLLKKTLGLPHSVNFSAISNPALEPLDAITINQLDVVAIHVIETLIIPLNAERPLSATTRRQANLQLGT